MPLAGVFEEILADMPMYVYSDGELNEPFTLELNNKGGCRIVTENGRSYNISKTLNESVYLSCSKAKCSASRVLYLNKDEPNNLALGTLGKANKHHQDYCIANPRKAIEEEVRRAVLEQAPRGTTLSKAIQIVTDNLVRKGRTLDEISRVMKPRNKMASAFSIAASNSLPPAIKGQNSSNIVIVVAFRRTRYDEILGNDRFLLKQVELGEKAVWVFGTDIMIKALFHSDIWAVDGYFSIPDPFKQLVTIHARVNNSFVPAIYAFLPDKQKDSYVALVNTIVNSPLMGTFKERGHTLAVERVNSDFELNIVNSFRETLATTDRSHADDEKAIIENDCCYFHFRKALIDKMKDIGLANACYNLPETRVHTFLKALVSLAFIPPVKVIATYSQIKADRNTFTPQHMSAEDARRVREFMAYFERYYLGVTALYQQGNITVVERWNVFGREFTTNNHVESWHSSKNDEFSKIRSIWKYIIACQESASQDIIKYHHIRNNTFVPQKTNKQKKRETTIKHVVDEYTNSRINELDVVKALMSIL